MGCLGACLPCSIESFNKSLGDGQTHHLGETIILDVQVSETLSSC
jgi:hypothetical protein